MARIRFVFCANTIYVSQRRLDRPESLLCAGTITAHASEQELHLTSSMLPLGCCDTLFPVLWLDGQRPTNTPVLFRDITVHNSRFWQS